MKILSEKNKKSILKLTERGLSAKGISKILKGISVQQIAAVKAWKTMTHSRTTISSENKNKILQMIRKGLTTQTIVQKFRSYTRQQIAAIRAWHTMGAY